MTDCTDFTDTWLEKGMCVFTGSKWVFVIKIDIFLQSVQMRLSIPLAILQKDVLCYCTPKLAFMSENHAVSTSFPCIGI